MTCDTFLKAEKGCLFVPTSKHPLQPLESRGRVLRGDLHYQLLFTVVFTGPEQSAVAAIDSAFVTYRTLRGSSVRSKVALPGQRSSRDLSWLAVAWFRNQECCSPMSPHLHPDAGTLAQSVSRAQRSYASCHRMRYPARMGR